MMIVGGVMLLQDDLYNDDDSCMNDGWMVMVAW